MYHSLRKLIAGFLVMAITLSGFCFQAAAETPINLNGIEDVTPGRTKISFNNDWRFLQGDTANGKDVAFDHSKWQYVGLPHNIKFVTYEDFRAYVGIAWYRKEFVIPPSFEGKKIFINFGAAMQYAEVYVNGDLVGTHEGGYCPFMFDITDKVKVGGELTNDLSKVPAELKNLIAVKINTAYSNDWNPARAEPDFQYHGGLYRNVDLIITDKVHITDAVFANKEASGGVFVRADGANASDKTLGIVIKDKFNAESINVFIGTHVKNEESSAKVVTVKNVIADKEGEPVFTDTAVQTIAAGGDYQFQQRGTFANAKLWHPYSPYRYTVKTTVSVDGVVVDTYETKTGFRTVEYTLGTLTTKGKIIINGETFEPVGTNSHQDMGGVGNAVPEDSVRAEVRMIKDAGFDFVRASHYPYQDAYYDACDEYGVFVQAPITGWHTFNSSNTKYMTNTYNEAKEMVRRLRNHPSIALWEMHINETSYTSAWATEVNRLARLEFPTKQMLTTGGVNSNNGKFSVYDLAYMAMEETPDETRWGTNSGNLFYEYGDWQFGGSSSTTRYVRENQSEAIHRQAVANLQYHLNVSQSMNRINMGYYWVWQDYCGFSSTPINCGIVDMHRVPKYAYYFTQSQRDPDLTYQGIEGVQVGPMAFIANRWTSTAAAAREVPVYSNAEEVELFLNGVSQGKKTPDTLGPNSASNSYALVSSNSATKHPPFTFTLPSYAVGTLKAVAYIGGEPVAQYSVTTPGAAAKLSIRFHSDAPLKADGGDARLIYIDLLDANGNIVSTDSSTKVTLEIQGDNDAQILGGATVTFKAGQISAWLKAGRTPGEIKVVAVVANSGIAESNTLKINSEAVPYMPPRPIDYSNARVNLAEAKPATASSNSENAGNAVDGRSSTSWTASNGAADQYWQVDLGQSYEVDTIEVTWAQVSAYKYKILFSEDGVTWFTVIDQSANAASAEKSSFQLKRTGRFVRILFTGTSGSAYSIRSVAVFGSEPQVIFLGDLAYCKPAVSNGHAPDGDAVYGNDGAPYTSATAPDSNAGNTWTVDLCGYYALTEVNITWEDEFAYKYKLEVSNDSVSWQTAVNNGRNTSDATMTSDVLKDVSARFVRITSAKDTKPMSFIAFEVYGGYAADLALGKKTTANGSLEGYPAFDATNGHDGSMWKPDKAKRTLEVDLDGSYDVAGVKLVWEDMGDHYYSLLGSSDGAQYYEFYRGTTSGEIDCNMVYMKKVNFVKLVNHGTAGVVTFTVHGEASVETDVSGSKNPLVNPGFEAESTQSAKTDPVTGWSKIAGTDTGASYTEAIGSHGGNNRGSFWSAADYSASLYQTVKGLPNGTYDIEAWVLRGNGAGDVPAELSAYVENYGGATVTEDLTNTAKYPNLDTATYAYSKLAFNNVHVTNGQVTIGFYANANGNNFFNVDDVSLKLVGLDPQLPVYQQETLDPVTGIYLDGKLIDRFNILSREYSLQWYINSQLPFVTAAAVAGIEIIVTQPTSETNVAVITARSIAYGDETVYKITFDRIKTNDAHRPSAWGKMIDIQSLPLGTVKYESFSSYNYYYVDTPPTSATARGDLPFVGIYPNRRLTTAVANTTADVIQTDASTGKKIYVHKNGATGGSAVADSLVGIETRNTSDISGKTLVMYAKFRPVAGSFQLTFRDGGSEARSSAEVFKVTFYNSGIRYSNADTITSTGTNEGVSDALMTSLQTTLDRSLYYEVWMLDSPSATLGHNCSAYIKYTNASGTEVLLKVENLLKTGYKSNTVQWPLFSLYEGNTTASVNIEEFNCYLINTDGANITFDITGPSSVTRPMNGSAEAQLSAKVIHTADDKIPVPGTHNIVWSIVDSENIKGVSIDQTGKVTVGANCINTSITVKVSGGNLNWTPVYYVITVNGSERDISVGDKVEVKLWSMPDANSAVIDPMFKVTNLGTATVAITLYAAAYDVYGKLIDLKTQTVVVDQDGTDILQISSPKNPNAAEYKFFIWDQSFSALAEATSVIVL